jgi:hypothetical protein
MNRRKIFGLLTVGAVVLLSGCDVNSPTMGIIWEEPYYTKLKVEVETPEGIKTGYSVIEVIMQVLIPAFEARGWAFDPATGLGTGLDIRGRKMRSRRVAVAANDNDAWRGAAFRFDGWEMAA